MNMWLLEAAIQKSTSEKQKWRAYFAVTSCFMSNWQLILLLIIMIHVAQSFSLQRNYLFHRRLVRSAAQSCSSWANSDPSCTLVIVESPAKARTIQKFVDSKTHIIDFSVGHIRDLASGSDEALILKGKTVCPEISLSAMSLGIDVFDGFKPVYVPMKGKHDVIKRLKALSKQATRILLATDEDREGEAISWHLIEVLKPKVPYKRAVFHEITKDAILRAFENPRDLDMNLVHSQETRRILDRLAGFTVSPMLWRFVAPALSAGRVQSCGLFSITERERKRWKFVPSSFCSLSALLECELKSGVTHTLLAKLQALDGQRIATEKDYDSTTGELRKGLTGTKKGSKENVLELNETACADLSAWLAGKNSASKPVLKVTDIDTRKTSRKAPLPFITSSLQQEASRKIGMSPSRCMGVAQGLYEKGHITYMRTDSPTLSTTALEAAQEMVVSLFGKDHLATAGAKSSGKSVPKNAQEAHEAIRPAKINEKFPLPEELSLTPEEKSLYSLIFRRTLASVMAPSQSVTNTYTITGSVASSGGHNSTGSLFGEAVFKTSDTVTTFQGFQAAMLMFSRAGKHNAHVQAEALLRMQQTLILSSQRSWASASAGEGGERAVAVSAEVSSDLISSSEEGLEEIEKDKEESEENNIFSDGLKSVRHFTRPPSRFTEAAFIQEMEELGVGRPSTYSSIIQTLKNRNYVVVEKQTIVPTVKGMIVSAFLEKHFPQFVHPHFTAEMEKKLDLIAHAQYDKQDFLERFYLGVTKTEISEEERADLLRAGLLPSLQGLIRNGGIDQTTTRCLDVPFLRDLHGQLKLNRDTVSFVRDDSLNSPDSVVAAAAPISTNTNAPSGMVGGENGTDSNSANASAETFTWVLPQDMQQDMRQITPEAISAFITSNPPSSNIKQAIGIHPDTQLPVFYKIGRYGPYLQMGNVKNKIKFFSIPKWVSEETLTSDDAIIYCSMPLNLGMHPQIDAPVLVHVDYGKLVVLVQGYPTKVILPEHTDVSAVTLNSALSVLPDAHTITTSVEGLGLWNGSPVFVLVGRFGPYLRCGDLVASLKGASPDTITLDEASHLLQTFGKPMGSRSKNSKSATAAKEKKEKREQMEKEKLEKKLLKEKEKLEQKEQKEKVKKEKEDQKKENKKTSGKVGTLKETRTRVKVSKVTALDVKSPTSVILSEKTKSTRKSKSSDTAAAGVGVECSDSAVPIKKSRSKKA